MAKPTLTYFDFPGGRGEDCRIALHIAGVDFHDDRVKGGTWRDRKAATPFGKLPVLMLPDKGELAQSNAILSFIGRYHDLLPSDGWEAARHHAIMESAEDLRADVATTSSDDEDEKKARREAFVAGPLSRWASSVEAQIGDGPFFGGSAISVADLKLFVLMKGYVNGVYDHVPADFFAGFPKLSALYEAVQAHEGVQSWYAR